MTDAADKAAADEERAMALLEAQQRQARIDESLRGFDPTLPQYCNDCAELIDPERMAAYPRASRCTACGTAYETASRKRWAP